MAVRSTMSTLITRVRVLINDPATGTPIFLDQTIQDVLDASRADMYNVALIEKPTFIGSSVSFLDYFSTLGDWEDDLVLKQYLTVVVTPSASENIVGHWQFAATTFPPVYITGKTYDIYRASADLLERWAAQYVTRFDFSADGQSFRVSQATAQLQALAKTYRQKQRATSIAMKRGDLAGDAMNRGLDLGPRDLDMFAQG